MLMYRRLPYAIDTSKQISERGELSVSRTNQTKGIKQWVNAVFYCYLVPGYHAHTGCIIHGMKVANSCFSYVVWRMHKYMFTWWCLPTGIKSLLFFFVGYPSCWWHRGNQKYTRSCIGDL